MVAIAMNVSEAKARLSELISAAERGDHVVISRAGQPVVQLVPVEEPPKRELGFVNVDIPDEFFDVLSDSELAAWE